MYYLQIWSSAVLQHVTILFSLLLRSAEVSAWFPDTTTKVINDIKQISTITFLGNNSFPNHFTVLNQDTNSIILGGRNTVYNLSIYDFTERKDKRLKWFSSDAHTQICQLKGKSEDDCQNYIRILVSLSTERLLVCGTNSYKPYCRHYTTLNDEYVTEKEFSGVGICPFNPEYNNTAVQSNGQIFTATIADFSERDPVIYREPQRTELSDLKQLNAPNFVSSMPYDNYIFFFFRETAVEYLNCGKIIYSRVARVCQNDKGGPHQFGDRWTSFLKARLNCSLPGEYPFYFDEIQSTSNIIQGRYGSNLSQQIIYGTLTTPNNAIGGSAICAYSMRDILRVFEGSFKQQESINSNWLPVSRQKVPEPRPGQCVNDSRLLPESVVNFAKTHSLMEDAVPALFNQPILVRVSLQYRFTAITVDPQVETVSGDVFDVLYVGTDNGKVLKVVNIPNENGANAVVISENAVFSHNTPVRELRIAPGYGRVVVVSSNEVKLATFNHCSSTDHCQNCVALQDPHCAWDTQQLACVSVDAVSTLRRSLIQDVPHGNTRKCSPIANNKIPTRVYDDNTLENEILIDGKIEDPLAKPNDEEVECDDGLTENRITGCAVRQHLVIYTAKTLHVIVVCASLVALFLGFIAGYLFSRRFHPYGHYPNAPFIEQHNHLERLSGNPNGFLTPRANKTVNLVLNVPPSPAPKKDNLETKDLNIASDGTLQKIKKTYI
ncbi:hypothetical protein PPYR_05432 [Photinus pyralis]|uniref:Sema domain-containing protein n=1 Tax=Photinus pyralis TaxID=7054 RepID=A0A1Y1K0L5_PHOPY|nr:semaphorin-1A-like [Photinus pyralis]KAB0801078.1 hypothetical protein PPYR_05432 [Photinus pyralis]